MGRFVNPGNSAFQIALNSEIYIDKTGLLTYTNRVMNTLQGYICNSRPRRFGKSITANMLTAYYSRGCDSRAMFKGTEPTKYIQLAYLTGILPIKKVKTQSTLNNFDEFTMLDAGILAPYIGFTEDEVRNLCEKYHRDFYKVKNWYDGYLLEEYQVYNPRAVVSVMLKGKFKSYWSETSSYEVVVPLINKDFDGLKTSIIEMLSGSSVKVNTRLFQNDTISFGNKDDVLTYLIHLGYLGYDQLTQSAFVPNEEIRQELSDAVERSKWNEEHQCMIQQYTK